MTTKALLHHCPLLQNILNLSDRIFFKEILENSPVYFLRRFFPGKGSNSNKHFIQFDSKQSLSDKGGRRGLRLHVEAYGLFKSGKFWFVRFVSDFWSRSLRLPHGHLMASPGTNTFKHLCLICCGQSGCTRIVGKGGLWVRQIVLKNIIYL